MSAVIKQRSGGIPIASLAARLVREPESIRPDPNVAVIAALRSKVATLEQAIVEASKDAAVAVDRARAEAHANGLAEAIDREEAKVAALREGIALANQRFSDALETIESLAPRLARRALDRLYDPADAPGERVTAMLARTLDDLREAAVQTVFLGRADHDALAAGIALPPGVELAVDDRLQTGQCRIALRLGTIDLSVREQWDVLMTALDRMAGA